MHLMWRFEELLLFTGAVYGLSWLVTRSKLAAPVRRRLEPLPFLGPLVHCIVCTSAWVAIGLVAARPAFGMLSASFAQHPWADGLLLVGWSLFTTWALGRALGDAT